MYDSAAGKVRQWWGCGSGNASSGAGICYGEGPGNYIAQDILGSSFGLCDIAYPTVIQFNGRYFLYAAGIVAGNSGCAAPGTNGNVCGFVTMTRDIGVL